MTELSTPSFWGLEASDSIKGILHGSEDLKRGKSPGGRVMGHMPCANAKCSVSPLFPAVAGCMQPVPE